MQVFYRLNSFAIDGAPAHTAKLAQDWIATNCSVFIGHQTHQALALLIITSGELSVNTKKFQPKQKNTNRLKKVLKLMQHQLPQDSINKATQSFTKRHWVCVKGGMDI